MHQYSIPSYTIYPKSSLFQSMVVLGIYRKLVLGLLWILKIHGC